MFLPVQTGCVIFLCLIPSVIISFNTIPPFSCPLLFLFCRAALLLWYIIIIFFINGMTTNYSALWWRQSGIRKRKFVRMIIASIKERLVFNGTFTLSDSYWCLPQQKRKQYRRGVVDFDQWNKKRNQVIWWCNLEDWEEKFSRRIPQPRAALGVVSKLPAAFPSPKLNRSFRVYHNIFPVTEWTFK